MSAERPFTVGIAGAGIAGLGAAIGLRRAGHDVEVGEQLFLCHMSIRHTCSSNTETETKIFERSQFKNEVGAAITITPNATRVLDHWEFDYEKAGAVENHQVCFD